MKVFLLALFLTTSNQSLASAKEPLPPMNKIFHSTCKILIKGNGTEEVSSRTIKWLDYLGYQSIVEPVANEEYLSLGQLMFGADPSALNSNFSVTLYNHFENQQEEIYRAEKWCHSRMANMGTNMSYCALVASIYKLVKTFPACVIRQ